MEEIYVVWATCNWSYNSKFAGIHVALQVGLTKSLKKE